MADDLAELAKVATLSARADVKEAPLFAPTLVEMRIPAYSIKTVEHPEGMKVEESTGVFRPLSPDFNPTRAIASKGLLPGTSPEDQYYTFYSDGGVFLQDSKGELMAVGKRVEPGEDRSQVDSQIDTILKAYRDREAQAGAQSRAAREKAIERASQFETKVKDGRLVTEDRVTGREIPVVGGGSGLTPEDPNFRLTEKQWITQIFRNLAVYENDTPEKLTLENISEWENAIRRYGNPAVDLDRKHRVANIVRDRLTLRLLDHQAATGNLDGFRKGFNEAQKGFLQRVMYLLQGERVGGVEVYHLRIREAIAELEDNEGGYFRLRTSAAQDAEDARIIGIIQAGLETSIGASVTAGVIMLPDGETAVSWATKQAELSFNMAKRLMNITGEANFWGGPVNPRTRRLIELEVMEEMADAVAAGGRWTNPDSGQVINVNGFRRDPLSGRVVEIDMRQEAYWKALEIRRRQGIQKIPSQNFNIPPTRTFVDRKGNNRYNFDIGHGGPSMFKNVFFAPEVFEENGQGTAAELRYAAETRVRGFVFFKHGVSLTDFINDEARFGGGTISSGDHAKWSGLVNSGVALVQKFYNIDKTGFLDNPLPNANAARGNREALQKCLEPVAAIMNDQKFLPSYDYGNTAAHMRYDAAADTLEALLRYMQSEPGRRRHAFLGWSQNLRLEAIELLGSPDVSVGQLIRNEDVERILTDLRIHRSVAGLDEAFQGAPEATGGVLAGIARIFFGVKR